MWALCYFLYNERRGTVVLSLGGGGVCAPSRGKIHGGGGHLKFKNQCQFQYDTTKVDQFLRLFRIMKLLILIQCFYFTHIMHSNESLVYNRFYIVYDSNHYIIVYNQYSIYSGTKLSLSNFSVLPLNFLPLHGHLIIIRSCMPSTVLYVIHVDL